MVILSTMTSHPQKRVKLFSLAYLLILKKLIYTPSNTPKRFTLRCSMVTRKFKLTVEHQSISSRRNTHPVTQSTSSPSEPQRLFFETLKDKKKYSAEFVVVDSDLTPVIGARVAQQIALITVHDDNFITVSPPSRRSGPRVKQITAEEPLKQHEDMFNRQLGTFPGEVHLENDNKMI